MTARARRRNRSTFPALEQAHNATLRQRAHSLRDILLTVIAEQGAASPRGANAVLGGPLPADRGRLQAWILDVQLALARVCGLDPEREWSVDREFGAPASLASHGTDVELIEHTAWDARQLSQVLIPAVRSSRDGLGEVERHNLGREPYTWCDLVVDVGRSPRARRSSGSGGGSGGSGSGGGGGGSGGSSIPPSTPNSSSHPLTNPSTPRELGEMATARIAAARASLGLSVPACAHGPFGDSRAHAASAAGGSLPPRTPPPNRQRHELPTSPRLTPRPAISSRGALVPLLHAHGHAHVHGMTSGSWGAEEPAPSPRTRRSDYDSMCASVGVPASCLPGMGGGIAAA